MSTRVLHLDMDVLTGQNVVQCVTKETCVRVSSKQLMAYTGGCMVSK